MGWGGRWEATRRVGHLFTYGCLLPLCALLVVVMGVNQMPAAINAAQGEGQAGTFVAQDRQCSWVKWSEICSWDGTFESADGLVRVEDVHLDTDTPRRVGDRVAVLYEGETDPPMVYLAEGAKDWLWLLLLLLCAIGYLCWGGWWFLRRQNRRAGVNRADATFPTEPGRQSMTGGERCP